MRERETYGVGCTMTPETCPIGLPGICPIIVCGLMCMPVGIACGCGAIDGICIGCCGWPMCESCGEPCGNICGGGCDGRAPGWPCGCGIWLTFVASLSKSP